MSIKRTVRGFGREKKKSPRLTVCLDSLNSTYLEEWAICQSNSRARQGLYVFAHCPIKRHATLCVAAVGPFAQDDEEPDVQRLQRLRARAQNTRAAAPRAAPRTLAPPRAGPSGRARSSRSSQISCEKRDRRARWGLFRATPRRDGAPLRAVEKTVPCFPLAEKNGRAPPKAAAAG